MKVKTLRPHENAHGEKYAKAKGDVYSLDSAHADMLIRRGIVEKIDDEDGEAERVSGTRSGADRIAEGNRKERAAKGGEAGAGADAGKGGEPGTA